MSNDKTMTAHFAIIRDNSSRYNRDTICQVESIIPEHDLSKGTLSRCNKFRYWESGRLFISDVITVDLPIIEDPEREIDACNMLISTLNAEAHKRLEQALEPVRARKLELMQIAHNPAPPPPAPAPKPEEPIAIWMDEIAEMQETFDLLDNGVEINERT